MRLRHRAGVWELFIPGVGAGARYKYEICYNDGSWHQKADPLARATEVPPATASVVTDSEYAWGDDEWMRARTERDPHNGPVSVYEVQLGSWRQGLGYRGLAEELVPYVQEAGFTHVEFLPVAEHPFGGSWGYQVSGYYAPTSRFGSPDDLRYLIDRLHRAGFGVIMDWVPGHFPTDVHGLGRFDGTALYECAAAMFIAQAYGLPLDLPTQFIIVLAALLTSVGVAGIPSASLVAIALILGSIGLPLEGVSLVLAVDRILDMCRTAVNVFGDSCATVVVARLNGEDGVHGEPALGSKAHPKS